MNYAVEAYARGVAHPGGLLRRMISLDRRAPDMVVGWLEDDFHHFGVTVVHDEGIVRDIRMAAPRHPWATCPGAALPLRQLVGKPLITRASELGALINMRLQCTHVFDLASLVLVQAATGRADRTYEVIIPDRTVRTNPDAAMASELHIYGPGTAILKLDGRIAMQWDLDNRMITGPEPYGGHSLGAGFREWTEGMPQDPAEYATILRRAILVAGGRHQNLDAIPNAAAQNTPPVCWSFQPEQRHAAARIIGTDHNYEASGQGMLSRRNEIP